MKTILKTLIILLVIGITFSGCDSVESLADVKFTSNLSGDLNVVTPSPVGVYKSAKIGGISFSEQTTIDPKSDSDINKYIDKIKSMEVQEVTGTVTKVSKPVRINSGTITIFQGSKKASWSVTNFDVVSGAKITLDSAEGQWNTINQILNSKSAFTAKIEGDVDNYDVLFTINILLKVKVVANPFE